MRHCKKNKEKLKQKHQKDHTSNSALSFPVVITIDSDSDKELEHIEFDSSITQTGTSQINEKENKSPSSFLGMTEYEDIQSQQENWSSHQKLLFYYHKKGLRW